MLKEEIPVAEIAKENGLSRPTIYKISTLEKGEHLGSPFCLVYDR